MWWFVIRSGSTVPTHVLSSSTPSPLKQNNTVVLLQQREGQRRILVCGVTNCKPSVTPESDQGEAVFDGSSWYRYRLVQHQSSKESVKLLERVWLTDNHTEPIVEQTPLVRPRDLFISPDGKRVAYWLDNTDNPKLNLTELWVYDSEVGSTRLIMEKVQQDQVVSPVRWNRASTHVWFMVHSEQATKIVVSGVKPVEPITTFDKLPWTDLEGVASFGIMDISLSGQDIAYVQSESGKSQLIIMRKGTTPETTTVQGSIPYIEWLPDGSLLYAHQEKEAFTLWHVQGKINKHVALYVGTLRSARSDASSETIVIAADYGTGGSYLSSVRVADGLTAPSRDIPAFGEATKIVQITELETSESPQANGISAMLSDEELVAFIEKNIETIVGLKNTTATRIIITDQPNTLYVDYGQGEQAGRVLVTIRDAIHPEWSIRGRYKQAQGDWKKIEGSGLADPVGKKVYEWEESIKQWVLKSG